MSDEGFNSNDVQSIQALFTLTACNCDLKEHSFNVREDNTFRNVGSCLGRLCFPRSCLFRVRVDSLTEGFVVQKSKLKTAPNVSISLKSYEEKLI